MNLSENAAARVEPGRKFTLTPKDIAHELDISERTVCRLMRAGLFPGAKVGGVWRSTPNHLREYLVNGIASAKEIRQLRRTVEEAKDGLDSNTKTIEMILEHLGLKRVQ